MATGMLEEMRAADWDTLYNLYFPDGGRVTAAAVVGCVCVDYLTCTECERILGHSFLAIEPAARKKQRTDPPVAVARVDDGRGSDRVEGSDAAISGMADRLGRGSHPPLQGIEGSDAAISRIANRLVPGSNGVVEGFVTAISGMAARLGLPTAVGERAKELFRKMEEARAWPHGPGWNKFRSECPLAYAACLSIACRTEGSALTLRELARATDGGVAKKDIARLIAHIRRRLGEEEAGPWKSTGTGMVCVSSYVRRFGALVGLRQAESAVALEAARRLEEGVLDVRNNADSLAGAVVCLAVERAGARKPSVEDVAAANGLTKDTIYRVCRSLRPHADLLFGRRT
ncbi:unnamed protein product [Alopecurus aequalis]